MPSRARLSMSWIWAWQQNKNTKSRQGRIGVPDLTRRFLVCWIGSTIRLNPARTILTSRRAGVAPIPAEHAAPRASTSAKTRASARCRMPSRSPRIGDHVTTCTMAASSVDELRLTTAIGHRLRGGRPGSCPRSPASRWKTAGQERDHLHVALPRFALPRCPCVRHQPRRI
jgi:hypothetical protein